MCSPVSHTLLCMKVSILDDSVVLHLIQILPTRSQAVLKGATYFLINGCISTYGQLYNVHIRV